LAARNAIRRRRASSFSSASWAILSQSVCWRCDSARCVSVRLASSANSPHSAALVRNSEPGIGGFCSTNHGESEQNRSSLPHPVPSGLILVCADYSACLWINQMHSAANQTGHSQCLISGAAVLSSPALDVLTGGGASVKGTRTSIRPSPMSAKCQ
jgi:hypothetical protein